MVRPTGAARALATILVVYVILDILLTPVGGVETRPADNVTTLGYATVVLLFAGLALSLASLALLFTRPKRSPILAVAGAIPYFPAFLADQLGGFSTLRPPSAIMYLEIIQALVAILAIFLALRLRMAKTVSTPAQAK